MKIRCTLKSAFCITAALGLGYLLTYANAWGNPTAVTAKSQIVVSRLRSYARVEPITVTSLRAAEGGVIRGLNVIPGQAVKAGNVVGHLRGPEIATLLAQRRGAVASAHAAVRAAQHSLAIERENRAAHLATRKTVFEMEASLSQAKARLSTAEVALRQAEDGTTLRAPDRGMVVSLAAGDGERVSPGQRLLTLQSIHSLWIRAVYYGTDANQIRVGMRGTFVPADGSTPFGVEVRSILPTVQPGGGVPVGLRPIRKTIRLISGEAGTLLLQGTKRREVAVPTRALILDHGRWWVLIQTPHGNQHRPVALGPSRGDQTFIEHGLEPGAEVVVTNAYLEFHQNVSQHYQPPD